MDNPSARVSGCRPLLYGDVSVRLQDIFGKNFSQNYTKTRSQVSKKCRKDVATSPHPWSKDIKVSQGNTRSSFSSFQKTILRKLSFGSVKNAL